MRLVLTVISPLGTTEFEADQSMVDLLGMRGAIRMLKNRAFSQMPGVRRDECRMSISYFDAEVSAREWRRVADH